MIYRAKAPLRLGFAGGGSDLEPYTSLYGGAILNATINKYAYASIIPTTNNKIVFNLLDGQKSTTYESKAYIQPDSKNDLLIGAYNAIVKKYVHKPLSFELSTYVDAPAGSGLGSSSTLLVAIIAAFSKWLKIPLGEYDLAYLSYQIERKDLNMSGGKQDQYAATFGGFNFMEFQNNDLVIVNPLRINKKIMFELEYSLLLYYTGKSRSSAKIIDYQSKNIGLNKSKSVDEMHNIKKLAFELKNCVLLGDLKSFGPILHEGWMSKKNTAKEISSKSIDNVYQAALNSGATGGKVSGAGGGGFFIFYCPGNSKFNVIKNLSKFEGRFENFQFALNGVNSWESQLNEK